MLTAINKASSGLAYAGMSSYNLTGSLKSSKSLNENLNYCVYTRVVELAITWELTFYSSKSFVLKKTGLLSTGSDFFGNGLYGQMKHDLLKEEESQIANPR